MNCITEQQSFYEIMNKLRVKSAFTWLFVVRRCCESIDCKI